MNNSKNKNSMFIVFTGVIIAICRFMLGGIDTKLDDDLHILIIMAVINYIALGVVLLFLYNEFCKVCREKISSSGLDTSLKKRCNSVIFIFSAILLMIYLLFGIWYITILKTADLNDVISIIALAISIANNGLIEEYTNSFYKMVLKIAKYLNGLKSRYNSNKKGTSH